MRPLTAQELLNAWERGRGEPPVQRALLLLAPACPETSPEALARESVGRRDARLLTLREHTFGPRLVSVTACPACGERLETAFEVADIRVPETGDGAQGDETLRLPVAGRELTFRLPNSLDLAALAFCEDLEDLGDARRRLLGRCLLAAPGEELAVDSLPAEALQAVADRMAEADPQGDVELALQCPACGHAWQAAFDIASFFWTEVEAWARVLLHEIHALASAYGWREADILALSPWRRRTYLELIGG
jgi:uncharacterized protein (UPF0212 family)